MFYVGSGRQMNTGGDWSSPVTRLPELATSETLLRRGSCRSRLEGRHKTGGHV